MSSVEQASKFVTYYLESQKTGMRVSERDGVCYIVTPYYRADGNRIAVEVQILDKVDALGWNKVRYTDFGDTLSDARQQWLTPDHPSLDVIRHIAGRFQVELSGEDYALTCEGSGGSGQLEEIILAIVAVSGFIEPQRDPEQTTLNQFSNAGASLLKMFEKIHKAHPEATDDDTVPSDLAKNYKHYLYGFPKEE